MSLDSVVISVLEQQSVTERCLRTLTQHSPDSQEVSPRKTHQTPAHLWAGHCSDSASPACARIHRRGLPLAICPESAVIQHTSRTAGWLEHDDANAALLRQRKASASAPDLHLFVQHAGYNLRLTPWLAPFLEGTGLSVTSHEAKNQVLREKLLLEPLWKEGYGLLAAAASKEGDHVLTLEALFLQIQFFPDILHYRLLHTPAAALGKDALAEDVARKIRIVEARLKDVQKLQSTAQGLAAHFRVAALPKLHALYRDWLAIHGRAS